MSELANPGHASRAEELGRQVRARDPAARCIAVAEEVARRGRRDGVL